MPNILKCDCDHTRKDHQGGTEFTSDSLVSKCVHDGCTCKHYHADEATRRYKNELIMGSLLKPILFGIGFGFSMFLCYSILGFVVDQYDISYKDTPPLYYENGTEVIQYSLPASESLAMNVQMIATMFIGFIGLIVCMYYAGDVFQNRYRNIIKDQ